MPQLGKILVILGLALAGLGAVLWLGRGWGLFSWLGRLPGDFSWRGKNFSFYFPLGTSLLLSLVLTLLFWLFRR
jgi:ribose/xylose/arabinose/galactoside ABC-type transport system permease subunit